MICLLLYHLCMIILSMKNYYRQAEMLLKKNTITELALISIVQQLDLPYNTKQLRLQVKVYTLEHGKEIEKLSKNYLQTKDITFGQYVTNICGDKFKIDELFLVLVSQRYTTHICVVLNNGGTWSTTPWIKQCNCKLCFMCCSNGKEISCRYYVPMGGNKIQSGVDEMSRRKGPDTSLYEQELANFVSKSKEGKGIPVPKKRQLKIDTSFLCKKNPNSNTDWVLIRLLQNTVEPGEKQVQNLLQNVSKKSE